MTASAAPIAPARARRLPRVDARLVVGVLLVALSIAGGLRFAAAADRTVGVVALARDLPANHLLTADDLVAARIHASDSVLDGLVRADRMTSLVGRVLLFPIAGDGLVPREAIAARPRQGREITVPVAPEHALGGRVRVGDRVDVLGSFTKATTDARTLTVVHDAEVTEMVRSSGLFGAREGELTALTLSVPPDDAVFLAFAIRNADLDIVRTTGAAGEGRDRFDGTELR
jgi:Flp pilus assembly protein CpaB